MTGDVVWIRRQLGFMNDLAVPIHRTEVDAPSRDVQPDEVIFRHTEPSRIKDRYLS